MKEVAIVNVIPNKSTGNIAGNLYKSLAANGYNPLFVYKYGSDDALLQYPNRYKVGSKLEHRIHKFLAMLTGLQGYFSIFATWRLLRIFTKKKIDTIYLLNIHQWYLNEKMLFNYIAKKNLALVYIMIDEYPYLGRCCFATDCDGFITGCGKCPSLSRYPQTWFFDRSAIIYKMKQRAYTKMKRAVFVAPEFQVVQSKRSPMMSNIRTVALDESVDLDVYKPKDTSALKRELGIAENKIVLMSAAPFSDPRKGCKYFLELACKFEKDERFVFVHVGFDVEDVETPSNFIKVGYVFDQNKYAEYLSMADLLIFLSFADTLSNTCIATLGCGTPLLCFNISGMPYLGDSSVLTLVEPKNVEQLKQVVEKTGKKSQDTISICRKYAEKRYDQKEYNKRLIALAQGL